MTYNKHVFKTALSHCRGALCCDKFVCIVQDDYMTFKVLELKHLKILISNFLIYSTLPEIDKKICESKNARQIIDAYANNYDRFSINA